MSLNRCAYVSKARYFGNTIHLCVSSIGTGNHYCHSTVDVKQRVIQSRFSKFCGILNIIGTESIFHGNCYQYSKYCTTAAQKRISSKEKLKQAIKDYGTTIIVFHVVISLVSLACFYVAVCSGVNITKLLDKMNFESSEKITNVASGVGTFAIAYAAHKVFAPIRIGITLTAAPVLIRYLRRVGVLKSPKI